jgi:hypothetical protein
MDDCQRPKHQAMTGNLPLTYQQPCRRSHFPQSNISANFQRGVSSFFPSWKGCCISRNGSKSPMITLSRMICNSSAATFIKFPISYKTTLTCMVIASFITIYTCNPTRIFGCIINSYFIKTTSPSIITKCRLFLDSSSYRLELTMILLLECPC